MTQQRGSVELVDVTKRYGDVVAVDSINLSVQAGEFLSLLVARLKQDIIGCKAPAVTHIDREGPLVAWRSCWMCQVMQ